ncbi:MAG: hypothetical protein JW726_15790 [Anaerolineales bacterium]|nr:hypothetical protein [Anaerolineales bacterium]
MDLDNTMIITIAIVAVSVLCGLVITVAAIAIPFIIYRSQRKKAEALVATGTQGEAMIIRMEDTGMRINDDPRVSLLLEVHIPGHAPYQIYKTLTVPMIRLPQVQPGMVVGVLVDMAQPSNPDKVGLLLH